MWMPRRPPPGRTRRVRRYMKVRPSMHRPSRDGTAHGEGMLKNTLMMVALVALSLFVATGCSQDKTLADTAIKNAEKALTDMSADAMAYMPDEFKAAQDALAAAK